MALLSVNLNNKKNLISYVKLTKFKEASFVDATWNAFFNVLNASSNADGLLSIDERKNDKLFEIVGVSPKK